MRRGDLYMEFDEVLCTKRDIFHEMFHTIGLYHEHQRNDRDKYVKFNQNHLTNSASESNFEIIKAFRPTWDYDITSITHYQHFQGARRGLSSFEPVDNMVQGFVLLNFYCNNCK